MHLYITFVSFFSLSPFFSVGISITVENKSSQEQVHGHDQSIGAQAAAATILENKIADAGMLAAKARRMFAGENNDAEETEFGDAEGCPRSAVHRKRGNGVYPRRRP